jgi:heptose-I-phosphate ethanolaminephosphotransferase
VKKSNYTKVFFVVVMLLLPLICVAKWDQDLFLITLILSVTSAGILMIPYLFLINLKIKFLYWFVTAVCLLSWCVLESSHYIQEKTALNDLDLKIFLESNPQELKEYFISIIPLWVIIFCLIAIVLILVFISRISHFKTVLTKKQRLISLLVFIICCSIQILGMNVNQNKWGIFRNEYHAVSMLKNYYNQVNDKNNLLAAKIEQMQLKHKASKTKKTFVLIIGESTSKHHLGIYNYGRNTTPRLAARKDIKIFNDVISGYTSTLECLGSCLTFKGDNDTFQNFGSVNIMDIANACGIKTFWMSNQNRDGLFANSITKGASMAAQQFYLQDKRKSNSPILDANLLPYFQTALKDTAQEKFIILHLMGTHFQYKKRYSAAFNKFNNLDSVAIKNKFATTISKQKAINEYDNSVLYQDYFLDSVFNLLKSQKDTISCIYFSDHGEEVYDYRNYIGHNPQSNVAYLHEIPFITWNISNIKSENKPYQMNYFLHSLSQWMQIDFKGFDATKSLFSDDLNVPVRKLGNGKMYVKYK